jgi:hypothetical protein
MEGIYIIMFSEILHVLLIFDVMSPRKIHAET